MGQCFSVNTPPVAPNGGHQHHFLPEPHQQWANPAPATNDAYSGSDFSTRQRPSGIPERSTPPRPSNSAIPVNLKNRFIDKLKEQRHVFSNSQRTAIDHLALYDERKQSGLKNRDVLPLENIVYRNNKAARETLKRTASFLIVRDVLVDVVQNLTDVLVSDVSDVEKFLTQSLLTVQAEALFHQVTIGKNEVYQKILKGERICPMMMDKIKFDKFLLNEKTTIREIVQSCQMSGEARNTRLISNLEKLAHSYLRSTNRLPTGLPDGEYVDFGPIRIINELVGVWVGTELEAATHLYPREDSKVALIVIDPEDSTTCTADPSEGGPNERYYALGFEHCNVVEKQAAVLIQKLFYELGDLELRVAESKGSQPSVLMQEAKTAASSKADRNYVGSVELNDSFDEHDLDPQNRRKDLVNSAAKFNLVAETFPQFNNGKTLLFDSALSGWVRSPQFEKDMAGLKVPEHRAWTLNVECVNRALRETGMWNTR
jgi:hypothetical protein